MEWTTCTDFRLQNISDLTVRGNVRWVATGVSSKQIKPHSRRKCDIGGHGSLVDVLTYELGGCSLERARVCGVLVTRPSAFALAAKNLMKEEVHEGILIVMLLNVVTFLFPTHAG